MRAMRRRLRGLWRHPDFLKLWCSQTIATFGGHVSLLALPLTAVLVLNASPVQMGFLMASETAASVAIGLFAGVWVDRRRRRPILIAADLGRALLLSSIPIAAWLHVLRMEQLYVIGLGLGFLTLCFDLAYLSFLPALVEREHLVEANSKLEVTRSVARITGPGLAGALVQLLTAPIAILLDSFALVLSAFCLVLIRAPEPAAPPAEERQPVLRDIRAGLRAVLDDPLLRVIAGSTAIVNGFDSVLAAVLVLYLTREVGLAPAVLGMVFAAFAPGSFVGALLARPAVQRFGLGRVIVGGALLMTVAVLLIPLAHGLPLTVPVLVAAYFVIGVASPLHNVNVMSLQQAITPDALLGRVNGSVRFISWGAVPIGALIGGALGSRIGLQPTLFVGLSGYVGWCLWLFCSPIWRLRKETAVSGPSEESLLRAERQVVIGS